MNVQFACVAALLATSVVGQEPRGLLYTPRHQEQSTQGAATPALNEVRSNEVQLVVPDINIPYDSEQFAPLQAYTTMIGDNDLDGDYWNPYLFGDAPAMTGEDFAGIDALVRPRDMQGRVVRPVNPRSLFISASATVTHCMGAAGYPVTSGNIFRILPGGQAERFLSEAQVQAAFGINDPVNVDAACFYWHQEFGQGGIYLSFEDPEMSAALGGVIPDGAIVRIPQNAIGFVPSAYDGAAVVAAVVANSGLMVATEAQMDNRVVSANVADYGGIAVTLIEDLDGLTLDPRGGSFVAGGFPHPHLMFSGEALQGGSVLTTGGGGSIAMMNGVALGETPALPTTGNQVGLVSTKGSLDGLAAVGFRICHLATDSQPTTCVPGCAVVLEVGGGIPGAPVVWLLDAAPDMCAPDPVLMPFFNCGFPELYPFVFNGIGALGADGCATLTMALPAIPGWHARVQAASFDALGNIVLSTPTTVDL